jgi:4-amino-4-deoxy-L-arabinose transferase-like glycosyltransferase
LTSPTPALVAERAAQRLPRLPLLLFCAAYVIPGLVGRDPWRNADLIAFGYMLSLARGVSDPLLPAIAGVPANGALLPYWLGAGSIQLFGAWLDPALAARLPFALLLVGVLACTWYSAYHLARTEAALPLPFAFGGEAQPVDYARAIADGALLALMATLGLLQLGHETTPELVQLFATSLFLYAMAASPWRPWQARVAVLVALPMLAASGAPSIALLLTGAGLVVSLRSSYAQARRFALWLGGAALVAAGVATALRAWSWRLDAPDRAWEALRLLGWFTWPSWALAGWTLWRWRSHLAHRHIAVPTTVAAVSLAACIGMGASDRALMLGLPALAVLAAFALPTLQRSVAAAIDWFSVAFYSICAIAVWVIYASLQLGVPAKPAANVAKLAVGYPGGFSPLALAFAVAGTLAWIALVRWRTGRHRPVLWKSLVLPASGLTLVWLLLLTLTLPVLDYARSYRPLVQHIARHVPPGACVTAVGLPNAQLAALEVHGGWRVEAVAPEQSHCEVLLTPGRAGSPSTALERPGWTLVARERRPTERDEQTLVYRRAGAAAR